LREIPKSPGFGWWSSEKRDETNEKKRETENGGQGEGKGREGREGRKKRERRTCAQFPFPMFSHFTLKSKKH